MPVSKVMMDYCDSLKTPKNVELLLVEMWLP